MKTHMRILFAVSVMQSATLSAAIGFVLKHPVYPGLGEYQSDTEVILPGRAPQIVSSSICIRSVDASAATQSLAIVKGLAQPQNCSAKVVEDNTRSAKIETTCDLGSSTLTIERVPEDVVKMTSVTNSNGTLTRSVSTLRWLRRPCTAQPTTNPASQVPDPATMMPKASEQKCAEMRAALAKIRSQPEKIPPGMSSQIIAPIESAMKMQGCQS